MIKKLLTFILCLFLVGCMSGGSGGDDSSNNDGVALYMLWTDALHDTDSARVSRTSAALRSAGFDGFVVTYDSINPRPYTVPVNTPISGLPRQAGALGGRVIVNFVCNYSWERNGASTILGPGGGYTQASLDLAVQRTKQYYNGRPILLSWEGTHSQAAQWTFDYGKRLRNSGVDSTFYYNLIGSAGSAARNLPWGEIGALPAPSCGGGGGGVVNNEDGCNKSAESVPAHVIGLPPGEHWVWWGEGVNQHIGESLETTANRIKAMR